MKNYRVERIVNGKMSLVHAFNTIKEACEYAVAWSNEWNKSSFVTVPGRRGAKYFTHPHSVTGVYELRS